MADARSSAPAVARAARMGEIALQGGALLLALGLCLSGALMQVGLALGLVGWAVLRLVGPQPRPAAPGWPWLLMLALWLLLAEGLAGRVPSWPSPAYGMLAAWVALAAWTRPAVQRFAPRLLLLGLGLAVLLAAVQVVWGYDVDRRPLRVAERFLAGAGESRASGFFSMHLTFGLVAAVVVLWSTRSAAELGLGRGAAWGLRGLAVLGLLLSQARAPLLGVLAGLVVRFAGRWRVVAGVAVAGGLALGAMVWLNPALAERTRRAADDPRWIIWRISADLAMEHPLFGCGGRHPYAAAYAERIHVLRPETQIPCTPEAWPALAARFSTLAGDALAQRLRDQALAGNAQARRDFTRHVGVASGLTALFPDGAPHAHHAALSFAAQHGLPAAAAWFATLVAWAYLAWRLRRTPGGHTALALLAGWVVAGIFEHYPGDAESAMAWAYLVGAALSPAVASRPDLASGASLAGVPPLHASESS